MAVLVHQCAHCGARNSAMSVRGAFQNPRTLTDWSVFATCEACGNGSVAFVAANTTSANANPSGYTGDLSTATHSYRVQDVFPKHADTSAPESVPPAATKAFQEGAENLHDGRYTSAIAMFRRALDVGLKEFPSDIDAWRLEKRIDKLADAGLITKDLQAWAHKIRLEGNDAVHELDDPSKEQANEVHLFTELLLTYLFTLPAKIRANLPADA